MNNDSQQASITRKFEFVYVKNLIKQLFSVLTIFCVIAKKLVYHSS